MSKDIERRLLAIERRLIPPVRSITVIDVRGGLPESNSRITATDGTRAWECTPDETVEAFRARAKVAAESDAAPFIIFGGLPEPTGDDAER